MDWKTGWRSFYTEEAGEPEEPVIEPERTGFLVVDVQNVYVERPDRDVLGMAERRRLDAWTPFHERLTGQVIPRIAAMLETCRAAGIACFFARLACEREDGRDRPPRQKRRGLTALLLPKDAHAAQVVPELRPVGDDIVVTKTTDSALAGTSLRLILRNMEIETVVCAGVLTDQCVSSTVRSLADEGFAVIVLEDCCAAGTAALHERELEILNGIYCQVMRSDEFAALLRHTL
jgi:nicotinamidase-related amidase